MNNRIINRCWHWDCHASGLFKILFIDLRGATLIISIDGVNNQFIYTNPLSTYKSLEYSNDNKDEIGNSKSIERLLFNSRFSAEYFAFKVSQQSDNNLIVVNGYEANRAGYALGG